MLSSLAAQPRPYPTRGIPTAEATASGVELAYVTGKGSRPRVVPFGAKTGQALDRYLRVRALHPYASSPQLLLGLRGPMTADGVQEVLDVRSAQAGLDDVHPHRFRHTFAHRRLAGGRPERDLMPAG